MMKDNPWRGLTPYTEPKIGEKFFAFCGRSKATGELTSMILNNLFVSLYGKTGIGKTSLLQAGVFPYLRSRHYFPISIRLGRLSKEDNLAGFVISELKRSIGAKNIQSNCKELDLLNENCLWHYFSSTLFFDAKGQAVFPVLVFDQFEEIFLSRKDDAWFFMRQLYSLLDDSLIANEEKGQHSETNFRIVVSIREDELFRLDDCIDSLNLSEMLSNRFRLAELRDEEAREVILIPGDGIIKKYEKEELATQIIQYVKDKNGNQLNTLLLSLICDLLYEAAVKEQCDFISIRHLQSLGDNPLKEFYQSVANNFTRKQRTFVEERLVDINGRRNPVPLNEFEHFFGKDDSLFNGDKHIFNTVSVASDNTIARVELVHDLIAQTIYEGKLYRLKKRAFLQKLLTNGVFDCITLSVDLFVILFMLITQNNIIVNITIIPVVFLLLFSTYMLNVTRVNNDYRIEAFLLPQLVSTIFIYLNLSRINIYAYHVIKPTVIESLISLFLGLNLLMFLLSLYSVVSLYWNNNEIKYNLRWNDFFTFKRENNRFAQYSLVIGFVISICVMFFTPKTNIEKVRDRVEEGDSNAMIELGDYYLKYIPDYERAVELYRRAQKMGNEKAEERIRMMQDQPFAVEITPEMKVDAMRAFLASDSLSYYDIIDRFNHEELIYSKKMALIDSICNFYEKTDDYEAVMRWETYRARINNKKIWKIGYEFWRGEYVEQDMVRGFELYVKGKSHQNVVICLSKGWGVEKSTQRAKEYIKEEQCEQAIDKTFLYAIEAQATWDKIISGIFK